jgi:4'-phosphopantetheinyl transferase
VWWSAPSHDLAADATLLDDAERARCSTYVVTADRARFVAGRALARRAVAAELSCDPREVGLTVRCATCGSADHGKPRVSGAGGGDLDLSIAHAHRRVVVAVARGCSVGVDVERIGPYEDLAEASAGVLDREERAALLALAPDARAGAFFRYWTCKEAVLKATGYGLAIEPAALRVTPPGRPPAVVCGPPAVAPERVHLRELDAGPGYAACLALIRSAGR